MSALVALLAVAAIASVVAPLLVYSTTLAGFGTAHVLVELRVLDVRYRRVLRPRVWHGIAAALAVVFVLRCAANLDAIPRTLAHPLELVAGCVSILVVVPSCWARGRRQGGLAIAVAAALFIGLAVSPLGTLLVLAILHNLAPWPLVAAASQGVARRRAGPVGAAVYVAVPLLIATGLPFATLASVARPEATVLPTGPLFDHLPAFWGPSPAAHPELALHVFAACAYLQCAHYVGVLWVLPQVGPQPTRVPTRVVTIAIATGFVVAATYAGDFFAARAW
ncbi:MAG: hypothetical protein JNK45_17395, partial [Myxococcales bacterium]|nr:hypothetical protein [Myxococcales bacterium]